MADSQNDPPKRPSILIINPNSTPSMTASLEPLIQSLNLQTPPTLLTAPAPSPPSINSPADAHHSAQITLTHLAAHPTLLTPHAGILVACYSPHPLVAALRSHPATGPVIGIFEASILASLALLDASRGERFGIVSTGVIWETVLSAGVKEFLGTRDADDVDATEGAPRGRFAGVTSTGLSAAELHEAPDGVVRERIMEATRVLVRREGVRAVCLGCAGMVGMEGWVREACVEVLGVERGGRVRVVDGVKAGLVWLEGVLRCGF
ncbi:hypothetical protein K490DRAFT_65197 [Saccharata proteae CBS 121410]|uniref:DCG1-like protein n=1 Tax=Saccharata proteae CBS 121410 TaxID=1314787 RepID=A0A9P4LX94_9PEZI|nr:hypothetical protein K490DRAFT_65197 [Saccharata proteae CBS 121410]